MANSDEQRNNSGNKDAEEADVSKFRERFSYETERSNGEQKGESCLG